MSTDTSLVCTRVKKVDSDMVSSVVNKIDTGLLCTRVRKVDSDPVYIRLVHKYSLEMLPFFLEAYVLPFKGCSRHILSSVDREKYRV